MPKHKIDLSELLTSIDLKKRDYYSKLSDEEKKSFSGIVMLRFMSSSTNDADYSLIMTNEVANPYFYEMWEHPELQYLLLTASSSGKKRMHKWIANTKSLNSELLYKFIENFWGSGISDIERNIILNSFTESDFNEFVDGSGTGAEEAKKIKQQYKNRV